MDSEPLSARAIQTLNRYCVVCDREYGADLERHCTPNSLVVVKTVGLFKKEKRYFSVDGSPLTVEELENIKTQENAVYTQNRS